MTLWLLVLLLAASSLPAQTFDELSARATAARESNNIPQAVELYRQAVQLNPQWQEGWWFLGTLLYDADQFAPGRDAFEHFVHLNPQAAPGWAFLGLCDFETAEYGKALQHIEQAISLGADKQTQLAPVLLYHQALLLTRASQFDRALQTYTVLLHRVQSASINDAMLISIGLAALRVPLLPQQVHPEDKQLYTAAGKTASLALLGNYAQADSAFAELLQNYPNVPNVHYMHGVYLLARDPDQAFEEFKRELQVSPSNAAAEAMLAWGLLTQGDSQQALPHAEKAAQAADATAFSKYLFGRALVETGALQRGVTYLQEAEKADHTNFDIHVTLAAAYSRLGRPNEARQEREIAMQMESENRPVAQP